MKRGRVFCIRIVLRFLFRLNRSLSLLVGEEVGKLNIGHTFILGNLASATSSPPTTLQIRCELHEYLLPDTRDSQQDGQWGVGKSKNINLCYFAANSNNFIVRKVTLLDFA